MESCRFGKALDNECHKTTFAQKQGLKDFSKLEKDLQDIYIRRSGLSWDLSNENIKGLFIWTKASPFAKLTQQTNHL